MFARVAKIDRRFVLSATALSAIGVASVLAFAPVPVRAAGHGHQNEVNFKAYVDQCNKMDHNSKAYSDCMALAEGQ